MPTCPRPRGRWPRGALLGARGNSGVMLSQLLRGLADVLVAGPAGGAAVAARAVPRRRPRPGGGRRAASRGRCSASRGRGRRARSQRTRTTCGPWWRPRAAAGRAAVARTPSQLPALREAGVVDAGGRGWVVLLEALEAVLAGRRSPPGRPRPSLRRPRPPPGPQEEAGVRGAVPAARRPRRRPSPGCGRCSAGSATASWSSAVRGCSTCTCTCTSTQVGAAVEAGLEAGRPFQVTVTRFADRGAPCAVPTPPDAPPDAVVAVACGAGLVRLFEEAGAHVVQAPAPRRDELLAAVRATGARSVALLPNDPRTRAAAESAARAARAQGTTVSVVPTPSAVQGLAALAVHDAARDPAADAAAMTAAAAATREAQVVAGGARGRRPRPASACRATRSACSTAGSSWSAPSSAGWPGGCSSAWPAAPSCSPSCSAPARRTGSPQRLRAHVGAAAPGVEVVVVDGGQRHRRCCSARSRRWTCVTPLIRALGDRTAKPLADGLDLHTVGDLLHHYPRRYAERGQLTGFDELVVGEHATVLAEVPKVSARQIRPKLHKTDVTVGDGAGRHHDDGDLQPPAGGDASCGPAGGPSSRARSRGSTRRVQLANPECQLVDDDAGRRDRGVRRRAGADLPGDGQGLDVHPAEERRDRPARRSTSAPTRCRPGCGPRTACRPARRRCAGSTSPRAGRTSAGRAAG